MDQTPDAFAAALSSGDTDRVNRAIDTVENVDPEERAVLFDDCFQQCRELYESDDGYQRQSAVRFAAALYPRLAFRTVGTELTDAAVPADWTLEELETQRRRLRAFYVDALVDDDGRVRRAAATALTELAVTAALLPEESLLSLEEHLDMHAAVGHRTRYETLYRLVHSGELRPQELEDALDIDDSTLHYHLTTLVDAGLVENRQRTERGQDGLYT